MTTYSAKYLISKNVCLVVKFDRKIKFDEERSTKYHVGRIEPLYLFVV